MAERFFSDTGIAKSETTTSDATSNVAEFSVSEISGQVKRMVEDAFGRVRVRGEIGRVSRPASGHIYFDLKDDRAVLAAVTWKGAAAKLAHRPEEGMEVVATGKLTTFPGSSKYQIIVDQIEPAGAGALMALLEERKKKLEAEGLFAPERKQLLPYMPMTIGVVTSPTGAVIRDILHRISDRFPIRVVVWPVRVQGETTGTEVSNAVSGFNALSPDGPVPRPDVLIVARGGGSVEDLWGFNDEAVVRAVAASMIPVVSAVGHETDWTLVDLAADVRAPTPTGAAEIIVPVKADLEAHLATLGARLRSGLQRNMEAARTGLKAASRGLPSPDSLFALQSQRFDSAASGLSRGLISVVRQKSVSFERVSGKLGLSLLSAPVERKKQQLVYVQRRQDQAINLSLDIRRNRLNQARLTANLLAPGISGAGQRLGYAARSLARSGGNGLETARQRLHQAHRLLQSYSHAKTLERGFALVRDENGKVITRAVNVKKSKAYSVEFADGAVDVAALSDVTPGRPDKKPEKQPGTPARQGSLFE